MGFVRGWCGRCGTTWVGDDRCHCPRCCHTWDDPELFDSHRPSEICLDGHAMGLARTRNGIWVRPEGAFDTAS
ncbi:hypothetical protein [Pseudonocardia spinosispora]|uniref:FDXHR family putative zinc-binding protein n=1 Tax=Pseudonocardia spinosispora TaxID=103441 RepID=UPI0009FC1EE7